MDAGKRTINDVFNGSRVLEIPFFQRSYVWGEEQWERLLEDVESLNHNEPYFMGSVILKQKQTNTDNAYGDIRTVIDGQQRLTSISILLKVLSLKSGNMAPFDRRFRLDDESIVLKHNHNDVEAYNRIMNLNILEEISANDNISRAYQYFKENLDVEKLDFLNIANLILFVVIDLSPEEDEQQIFDTINSIGVKLTTAELLKNYFFDRNDLENYEENWKFIFEEDEEMKAFWDTEITAGRYKRSLIDLFFYSYLQIKQQEKKYKVNTEDKKMFSKVDKLFESYKKFIDKYVNNEKEEILEEIRGYAKLFRDTFDKEVIHKSLSKRDYLERINVIIFHLETTTLVPYILYIERQVKDEEVKNELYKFIESFIMRRLICKSNNKNYNQLFTDRLILNNVLSKEDFVEFLEKQDDKVNYFPSNEELEDAFYNNVLTNKQATGILYFLESKIRDADRHSTQLLGIKKYSLEHVMPKKWINNWGVPDDQRLIDKRNKMLLTLGNLTIITQSLNASIRDANWEMKKTGQGKKLGLNKYASGIEVFSEYLKKDDWNVNVIEERANDLYQYAIKEWDK